MLGHHGEGIVKRWILAAAFAAALVPAAGVAGDLHGRWAVEPGDCASNRYVWVFAGDRAGLFVDSAVVSGWRRASYRSVDGEVVAVAFDGAPRREFRWQFRGPDEIATVGVLEEGRMVVDRSFQVWRRCAG